MKWPTPQLKDVADIVGGSTPRRNRDEFWGGDILWLTPTDLPAPGSGVVDVSETGSRITQEGLDSCSASLLPEGTVLFSSRATIGKVGIAARPLATNQGFANFVPKKGVDSRYLAYTLMFLRDQIARLAGSTTFKEVSKSSLKSFRIPLPPPSEQRRIVEILDQADALRKKRAEADKIADRILPALFYKMFGDPATNPKGWDKVRLSDITTKITDGTHQPPPFEDSGIPFLFVQNIVSGIIDFSTRKFISPETYASLTARTKPERGDILYSTVGSYGVAVEVQTDREFAFQRHIGHIKPDHDAVNVSFLTAQLNTPFARSQADHRVRGVAQKTLNLSELREFELLCPPLKEQERFAKHVRTSAINAESRLESSSNLESLFSVLLHRAFSCKLTTKWREAHMKELLQEMEMQAKELDLESHE